MNYITVLLGIGWVILFALWAYKRWGKMRKDIRREVNVLRSSKAQIYFIPFYATIVICVILWLLGDRPLFHYVWIILVVFSAGYYTLYFREIRRAVKQRSR